MSCRAATPRAPSLGSGIGAVKHAADRRTLASPSASAMSERMKVVKKTDEWSIFQKRSGRYAVRAANGSYVNGDEKLTILAGEGLAKKPEKKAEPAPPEAAAEQAAPEAEEAAAEAEEEKPAE